MRKKDVGYKKVLSEASYSSFGLKNKKSVMSEESLPDNDGGVGNVRAGEDIDKLAGLMVKSKNSEWKHLEMTSNIALRVDVDKTLGRQFGLSNPSIYLNVEFRGKKITRITVDVYLYGGQKRFTLSRGFTFHYLSKKVEDIITSNNTGFSLDKRIGMKKGKGGRWSFESRKRYPVRGRRMSESDDVNDLSKYSKQEFVDYMVEHDIYSWAAAEMIYDSITDIEGSFILIDILKTYSEFDNYLDALSDMEVDMDVDDTEDFSDVELEEEAESLVRGQYDVLETKEGSIVVIGDY